MNATTKIFKGCAIGLAALVVLIAVLLLGFGVLMARAPAYRAQLQAWLSEHAQLDVQFGAVGAHWHWYGPELVFDRTLIRSADRQRLLASVERAGVGFDLWTALRSGRLTAARLSLTGAELKAVRTAAGKWMIIGQEDLLFDPNKPLQLDQLPFGRLEVRKLRLSFQDLQAAREPWVLQDIHLDFSHTARRLTLKGRAALPAELGKEVIFTAHTVGSLKNLEVLQWQADASGAELNLAGWGQLLPAGGAKPRSGAGSFKLDATFRGALPQAVQGRVDFAELALTLPQWSMPLPQADVLQVHDDSGAVIAPEAVATADSSDAVSYERARTAFDARRTTDGWQLKLEELQLQRANAAWQPSRAEVAWKRKSDGGLAVDADADLIVLDSLWPLLACLPENESNAHWRALNGAGRITAAKLQFTRDSNDSPARFRLAARLSGIGVAPVGKTPGFSGLSGMLEATETQGGFKLDSTDFSLAVPRLFRTPLPVDRLLGAIAWTRAEHAWNLEGTDLSVSNTDGRVQARFTAQMPDEGSPVIDLHANAADLNAVSAPRYMPAGLLSSKTLAWLDHAFTAGKVPRAELTLRGPLRSFPFRNHEGLFLITAQIEGLTLDYQQGWMPATAIAAQAEFRNAGLTATASSGNVNGLQVQEGFARFKDFKSAELELKATGSGELQHALDYLQQSPIGPLLGDTFLALQGQGTVQGQLDLVLPLKELDTRRLDVTAAVKDAQVGLKGFQEQAEAVNGGLRVHDKAIADIAMSGQFLQGPFAVTTAAAVRPGASPNFIASGRVRAEPLMRFFHLPGFVKLAGETDWRLVTAGPAAGQSGDKTLFTVDSALQGLSIDLPEPAAKKAEEPRALRVEAERVAGDAMLLRGSYGAIRSVVRVAKQADRWIFDRAGLRADGAAASLPGQPGLRIEGSLHEFELDDWLKLGSRGDSPSARPGNPLSGILRAANVNVERFRLWGYEWADLRGVLQATDQGWRVDVSGPQATGQVVVPYQFDDAHPLVLDLDHLALRRAASQQGAQADSKTLDPRDLPALKVEVKNFEYGEHGFGSLNLQTKKTPEGLQATTLQLASAAYTGNGAGSWQVTPSGQITTLNLLVESSDLRGAMQQLNYADFIEARFGKLYADLSWPGGIDEGWLGRTSGRIEIQAEDGQLLNLQPGAGRVLGLLSVAALPRRLSLDFRDITDKGLRFDTIHGEFKVKEGDAVTDNLLLRGPAAEIGIAGRIGFAKHDYDQTAVVTGSFGSTLPVAGTLAGGPVIGAALLLFTQIFKEPLKGVARGYYHIGGTWEEPVVERVDEGTAKESQGSPPPEKDS